LPLLEILRASFQIEDGDPPLQMEEKLRRGVEILGESIGEAVPFLHELFQLPSMDDSIRHLDPQTKRRRTFDAISALTVAAARHPPLGVALEAWHWADRTTEDYLAFFASAVVDVPILVITTQRPGQAARWAESPYC